MSKSPPPASAPEPVAEQPTVAPPVDPPRQITLSLAGRSTASPGSSSPPGAVPGYEILGELGRGGMGVVYKARQIGLNRVVALKMIVAGARAGPDIIGRFRAEAEAVARLQHPNIIQIYDIGEQDGCPFFSLEFADG